MFCLFYFSLLDFCNYLTGPKRRPPDPGSPAAGPRRDGHGDRVCRREAGEIFILLKHTVFLLFCAKKIRNDIVYHSGRLWSYSTTRKEWLEILHILLIFFSFLQNERCFKVIRELASCKIATAFFQDQDDKLCFSLWQDSYAEVELIRTRCVALQVKKKTVKWTQLENSLIQYSLGFQKPTYFENERKRDSVWFWLSPLSSPELNWRKSLAFHFPKKKLLSSLLSSCYPPPHHAWINEIDLRAWQTRSLLKTPPSSPLSVDLLVIFLSAPSFPQTIKSKTHNMYM